LDAQVGWGGNNTGRKYGVSKLEECISAAMEAFVEGAAELAQGIEAIGRFHGGSFCYRQVREATSWRRFVPEQLKRKLRITIYSSTVIVFYPPFPVPLQRLRSPVLSFTREPYKLPMNCE
jgi:hypothetical protein